MKPAFVALYVEKLVLHGFAAGDRHRIADALQQELAGLIRAGELSPSLHQSRDTSHIDAGSVPLLPGSRAETVGTQVAQAVYTALKVNRINDTKGGQHDYFSDQSHQWTDG